MEIKNAFNNLKYGKCYILEKNEQLFLVYVSNNYRKYIVCKSIDNMGAMLNQNFFENYESAKEYYDKELSLKK